MPLAKLILPNNYQLVLASQSPRRKELLSNLGYEYTHRIKQVDECYPKDLNPEVIAEYLSIKKSEAYVAGIAENEIIITADTVVLLNKKILGKAKNKVEATRMLELLSGKKHQVISGISLLKKGRRTSFSVLTSVYMKALKPEEINFYVNTFEPFDKAGAYGIQEWIGYIGVEKIEGSFYNVMGLPLKELYEALNKFAS